MGNLVLTDAQARLLLAPNIGVIATLRRDGFPHLTPVWVDWDGRCVKFVIRVGQAKERHLRSDDRVGMVVVNADDPYEYVSISGHVSLTDEGAGTLVAKLARKYLGLPDYPLRGPGVRVVAFLSPDRVFGQERSANKDARTSS